MTIYDTLTQQSGSLGDTVFSRNQHGPYTRDRTFPADPATALQVAVRAALSGCVDAWKNTLTATDRSAWDDFALAVRVRTSLGRSTNAGGLPMYIRANVPRIQAAVGASPRVDQAPTIHTSPPLTPVNDVVLNWRDDTLHPFFAAGDAWTSTDDAALLFYASPPRPLTVNFYRGPYRLAGAVLGSSGSPPTSPATIPLPFSASFNERVFVRLRLTTPDARITPSTFLPTHAASQNRPVPILATFTPGAPPLVDVQFDALLRDEPHSLTPWIIRWQNNAYAALTAVTDRDTIRITVNNVGLDFGIDRVTYAPPPRDLHSLLNGGLVRAFTDFPLI